MLKQRIITGSILLATILLAIAYLPFAALHILFGFILLLAAYELATLLGIKGTCSKVLYCGLLAVMGLMIVNANISRDYFGHAAYIFNTEIFIFWWFILVFIVLLHDGMLRNKKIIQYTFSITSTFSLLIAYVCLDTWFDDQGSTMRHPVSHTLPFISLVLLVVVSDTSAYFFGKRFGKKKFFPNISPNKTLAGFWASNLCVALYAVFYVYWLEKPFFLLNYFQIVTIFILLNLFAITGDLFISALKRHAGVKDSGALLPGHGGVLDRVDSMVPVLSVYFWIIWI